MLKKRLIGVVIVKGNWAVQSFGYNSYLPLGKPECLVDNLDRWGADEIIVLSIDRYKHKLGPDFALLEKISKLGLETPLLYGGGISSVSDGLKVIQLGADRVCVDSLLCEELNVLQQLSEKLGQQAIVGVMPIALSNGSIEWLNYRNKTTMKLSEDILEDYSKVISELLLVDWMNEGIKNGFDMQLIDHLCNTKIPLIPFGGINEQKIVNELLSKNRVSAVAIGNFLNYKEHSIQRYKKNNNEQTRKPYYKEQYSLLR